MYKVNIYIETTIKRPNLKEGWYGYIVEYISKETHTRQGFKKVASTTKNQIVLTAINEALSILKKPCRVEIHLDNLHIANCVNKGWIANWKQDNWTKRVSNIEDWKTLSNHMDVHQIHFTYTETHTYKTWMSAAIRKEEAKAS